MIKSYKDKAIIGILVLIVILLAFFLVKNIVDKKIEEKNANKTGIYYVDMKLKDYGIVRMELDANVAPVTVNNFINLVNKKFYDGLTFHKILPNNRMIGGDPTVDGQPDLKKTIKGEFRFNGVKNDISHVRGTVSMYRDETLVDSATSVFFIVQQDQTHEDGRYAAFGKVIKGMDVIDKIMNNARPVDETGAVMRYDQPIIEYMKVVNN